MNPGDQVWYTPWDSLSAQPGVVESISTDSVVVKLIDGTYVEALPYEVEAMTERWDCD